MGIWDIGKDDEWVLTLALLAMIYLQDLALNKKTAHMYKKAGGGCQDKREKRMKKGCGKDLPTRILLL